MGLIHEHNAVKVLKGVELKLHTFLTSTLGGVE